jgi:hypothetical protein
MTRSKGRPVAVDGRVAEALGHLERLGRSPYRAVAALMPDAGCHTNVSKYLRRAVAYGLATEVDTRPKEYLVVPDWRARLAAYSPKPAAPRVKVSSVWDLGRTMEGAAC